MVKTRAKPQSSNIQLPHFEIIQKSKKIFVPSSEKTLNREKEKIPSSLPSNKKITRADSKNGQINSSHEGANCVLNNEPPEITPKCNKDPTLANSVVDEKLNNNCLYAKKDAYPSKENLESENLESLIGKLKNEESKALPEDWDRNFGKRLTRSSAFKLVNNNAYKRGADIQETKLTENNHINILNGIKIEKEVEKEAIFDTILNKENFDDYKFKKIENTDGNSDVPKNNQLIANNINSSMTRNRGRLTRLIDFKLDSNLVRENSFIASSTENLPRNSFISDLIHNKAEKRIMKNNELNALNRILKKKDESVIKKEVSEEKNLQNVQIETEKSSSANPIQNKPDKNVQISNNTNHPTQENENKSQNLKSTKVNANKKIKKTQKGKGKKKKTKVNMSTENIKGNFVDASKDKNKKKNACPVFPEIKLQKTNPPKEPELPIKRSTRISKPNTNFKDLFVFSNKKERNFSNPLNQNSKNNENEHDKKETELKENEQASQGKKKASIKNRILTPSQKKNLEKEVNRFFDVQYKLAEDKQDNKKKESKEDFESENEANNSKLDEQEESGSLSGKEMGDDSSYLSSEAPNLTIPIRFSNSELSDEVSSEDEENDDDEGEYKEKKRNKTLQKKAISKKRDARPKKEGNPMDFDIFYENLPNLSNFFLKKSDEQLEIFRESPEKTSKKKNFLSMFNSKVNQQSIQEISLIAKKNAVFSLSAKDLDKILNSEKKDGSSNILQAFALDETLKSRILEEKPKNSKENKNATNEEVFLEDQNEIDSLNKSNARCTPVKKRIRKRKMDILLEKLTFTEKKSRRKDKEMREKEKPIKKEKKPKIFKIKRKRGRPKNLTNPMESTLNSENKREQHLRQKIINFPKKRGRRPGPETPIKPYLYWREAIKPIDYEKNNKKEIFRINEGIKLNSLLYEKEPVDFFSKFFDEEFFERLAEYTNISGRQEKRKTYLETLGKIWVDVNSDDIKVAFGLFLLFGIVKIENHLDFWNDQSVLYMENVVRLMNKEKFINIKRHLCFFDKTKKNINLDDPLYKIRNLLNQFDEKNQEIYEPLNDLSFIEYLISYEGVKRPKDKDKMYKKPGKVEISALTLIDSDSGYVMKISLNEGIKILEPNDALPLLENYQGNKYRVFFDKYTFSENVLTELKKRDIECCCFMRGDQCTLKPEKLNNIKMGQIDFYSNKELFATLWGKKNKNICLISNYQDFEIEKVVHSRKIGFLDNVSYKLYEYDTPRTIYDYIENMKKSTKLDYVFNNFSPNYSSWKWNLRAIFFILELAINNSFIIYQKSLKMRGLEPVNYFRFKMKIIKYLSNWDNAIIINPITEKKSEDLKEIIVPDDLPREEEVVFICENDQGSNMIRNKNKPLISVESKCKLEYIGGGICFTCKKRRKKLKKTVFWCKICQLGSCPECFDIHRTQTIFNRILNSQDSIMKFEIILETLINNKCLVTDCVVDSKTKKRRRRRKKIEMLALRRQYNLESRKEKEEKRKAKKLKKMNNSERKKEEKDEHETSFDDFDLDYTIQKKKKRKIENEQKINLIDAEKKSESEKEIDDENSLLLIQNDNMNMVNEEEIFVEDKPYLIQENEKNNEDIINTQANEEDEYRILTV